MKPLILFIVLLIMTGACMADECNHDKVYSKQVLTSNPPQHPWICRKCGIQGRDRGECYEDEYSKIVEKFRKKEL